jgi:LysM repeat protein
MRKSYVVLVIFLLACSSNIWAQDTTQGEEYVIQKNDTLWGISGSRLEDSFLWPKIWSFNPHISNPDLIYPGEKIRIPSREELKQQEAPSAEKKLPSEEKRPPYAEKLKTPEIKTPPSALEPSAEKHKKYLVDKDFYLSIGWISKDFPSVGTITATLSGGDIAGEDDIVYVGISAEKVSARLGPDTKTSLIVDLNEQSKDRFFTIRDVKTVKHPITGKIVGHLIRVTGIVEIIGMDDKTPKAKIISSFEDVQIGDGLMPFKDMEPPLVPDVVRTPNIKGYVIESLFTNEISGQNNVVFLDKGVNDGLLPGDVFTVFTDSPVKRAIGKIQVISLQPETSAAIILKSSEEITIGTSWGQK